MNKQLLDIQICMAPKADDILMEVRSRDIILVEEQMQEATVARTAVASSDATGLPFTLSTTA
jgi:hypothetical protein